jgi:hypothetical protein
MHSCCFKHQQQVLHQSATTGPKTQNCCIKQQQQDQQQLLNQSLAPIIATENNTYHFSPNPIKHIEDSPS